MVNYYSFILWGIITIIAIASLIVLIFYHNRIRDKHEILRLRPAKFYRATLPLVCFLYIIKGIKRVVYNIQSPFALQLESFYLMVVFSTTSIFFIVFVDTSYYLILRKAGERTNFLIKHSTKIRKYTVICICVFFALNMIEKLVFFYVGFEDKAIAMYTLQFAAFLVFFFPQMINVWRHHTDEVGLRNQIFYLAILIVVYPILHIAETLIMGTSQAFIYVAVCMFYQQLAVCHLIGLVQVGYPLVFLLNDKLQNKDIKPKGKKNLEELFDDQIFCKHFRLYLETNYCEVHLDFIIESRKIMRQINALKDKNSQHHESMPVITDNVGDLIEQFVRDEEEVLDGMNINNMFEGGIDTINIEKELKSDLRILRDKLTNLDMLAYLNPLKQVEIAKNIHETLVKTNTSINKMLRVNLRKFEGSEFYQQYMCSIGKSN